MFVPPDLSKLVIDENPTGLLPLPKGDFWVFGYGSLMWNPGFPFIESSKAELQGFHRSLCVWSIRYRGSPVQPGLVMGLDQGGNCHGRAFLIHDKDRGDTHDYLRDRETVTGVYTPSILDIELEDGRIVKALTFVVKQHHIQYAGGLSNEQVITTVSCASGQRGKNIDYVLNTAEKLEQLALSDSELTKIVKGCGGK